MDKKEKRLQKIDFESPIFELARKALDTILSTTITKMVNTGNDEADVNLKISIVMTKTEGADQMEDGDPARKTPLFTAKVSRTIKDKADLEAPVESKGHLVQSDEDMTWYVFDGDPQMKISDYIEG